MIKKLIASGALAGALALGAPAANAGTVAGTVNLGPGSQACVNTSTAAFINVQAFGVVTSGHAVRFTLTATGPAANRTVDDTGIPVTSWSAYHSIGFEPALFPSNFRECAINQSLKPSTVQLTLRTDS